MRKYNCSIWENNRHRVLMLNCNRTCNFHQGWPDGASHQGLARSTNFTFPWIRIKKSNCCYHGKAKGVKLEQKDQRKDRGDPWRMGFLLDREEQRMAATISWRIYLSPSPSTLAIALRTVHFYFHGKERSKNRTMFYPWHTILDSQHLFHKPRTLFFMFSINHKPCFFSNWIKEVLFFIWMNRWF